jgi:hypothetical protein
MKPTQTLQAATGDEPASCTKHRKDVPMNITSAPKSSAANSKTTAPAGLSYEEQGAQLEARVGIALAMGGEDKLAQRRASGDLNARERIEQLLDAGSFSEAGMLACLPIAKPRRPTPRSPAPVASKGGAWPWCRTT